MHQYKIFSNTLGTYKVVKTGWGWPSFFFGFIWALFKELWLIAFILFMLHLALCPTHGILSLVVMVYMGVKGNEFVAEDLLSRGYTYNGSITASNRDAALEAYLSSNGGT